MWFFPPWQGAEASKGPQDPWLQVEVLPSKQSMASPRMQQFVLFMFFTCFWLSQQACISLGILQQEAFVKAPGAPPSQATGKCQRSQQCSVK